MGGLYMLTTSPKYIHDCKNCIYIGNIDNKDAYICPYSLGGATLILRYGDEGIDNASYPITMLFNFYRDALRSINR